MFGYVAESTGLDIRVKEGLAIVFGIGTCTDVNIVLPHKYNGIPVTHIADEAFKGNKSINSIYCSNVTHIGNDAFAGSSLKNFTSTKLKTVGLRVFDHCQIESAAVPVGYSILF
jgi:hypothetical protein